DYVGRFRMLPTRANAQPAAAAYVRTRDDTAHRAFAVSVLRIEGGLVAEAVAFHDTSLFPAFGLPPALPMTFRAFHRPPR
ncbi:MAG: RNA polymerase subunit sigma-70, partial [Pseudonocardia sp.]